MIGVSINYRVSAFGFLAGSEVLEAGIANNGFRDQRLALQWINENVKSFGGDPTKVTIWGESSGAESVSAQVLAYNGEDFLCVDTSLPGMTAMFSIFANQPYRGRSGRRALQGCYRAVWLRWCPVQIPGRSEQHRGNGRALQPVGVEHLLRVDDEYFSLPRMSAVTAL